MHKTSRLNNCVLNHARILAEPNVSINNCTLRGTIYFGFGSYINSGSVRGNIEIGRYCSIGRDVKIGLGNHDMSALSTSSYLAHLSNPNNFKKVNVVGYSNRTVVIGNDVWIGDNAMIRSGIKIGHGVVIGAGSIITKDVPDYAVVVGVPGKVVKYRFDQEIINQMKRIEWWNIEPTLLHDLPRHLELKEYFEVLENMPKSWDKFCYQEIKVD